MLSALAGSIIRDVLVREIPMVMGPDDLYAIPAMFSAVVYVGVNYFYSQWIGLVVGTVLATALRLAATYPLAPAHRAARSDRSTGIDRQPKW